MTSTRDYATRLIVSKVVRDKLADADKDLRATAGDAFDRPGMRDVGLISDEQIGHVQMIKGAQKIRVYDEAAYMEWVEANHPQVVTRSVPSTWTQQHAKALRETGELPPGLEVAEGTPYLNVKPSEDAAEVIGQALADGRLTWAEVATAAIEVAP